MLHSRKLLPYLQVLDIPEERLRSKHSNLFCPTYNNEDKKYNIDTKSQR